LPQAVARAGRAGGDPAAQHQTRHEQRDGDRPHGALRSVENFQKAELKAECGI
jgi:hypothetical protein